MIIFESWDIKYQEAGWYRSEIEDFSSYKSPDLISSWGTHTHVHLGTQANAW